MALATVDPLNGKWCAQALAGDVMARCPAESPCLAVWIGEDGHLHYSKSGTSAKDLALFGLYITKMAMECL